MTMPQKITPFLWFNTNAEEAMNHYIGLFKNSRIVRVQRWGANGPGPEGSVMLGTFEINGQQFIALNGGPMFKFTEAISLLVTCESQQEVDELWNGLCEGGTPSQCGWLKDKFGLSWQIVPREFMQMAQDPDPAKVGRVMAAMMQMSKFDIAKLRLAFQGP